jgi:two-component system nitrate/nitrite response regulator NarL
VVSLNSGCTATFVHCTISIGGNAKQRIASSFRSPARGQATPRRERFVSVRHSEQSNERIRRAIQVDTGRPGAGVRVYIASDVRLYREGLLASLSRQCLLEVVGAGSLAVTLRQLVEMRPDVLLLDLMAKGSLLLPRQAQLVIPALRVVAFAVAEVESDVLACAEAGICGYIAQDASGVDLAAAVARAMRGELACSPRISGLLYRRVGELSTARPRSLSDAPLTRREREVAGLVSEGLSNKEIARRLRLGNPTVKNHVHNILQKLDVHRRGQIRGTLESRPQG